MNPLTVLALFIIGFVFGVFVTYKTFVMVLNHMCSSGHMRLLAIHKCDEGHVHAKVETPDGRMLIVTLEDHVKGEPVTDEHAVRSDPEEGSSDTP